MPGEMINWGIIGPGRIANKFAQAFKAISDGCVHAVASRDQQKAKAFAAQYDIPKAYSSYKEMLADPQVDMVYIATPNRFHHQQAVLCLEADKPVLCEKPLTVNAVESSALIDLAREKDLFLMEAVWTRYLPIYQVVRQWLDEGVLGKIWLLDSKFGHVVSTNEQDRWYSPELAGGVLLDMGIYNVSTSQWVMDAAPVSYQAFSQISDTGIDELTAVILRYENGAVSQFTSTFLTNTLNDFLIYGENGYVRIHGNFWESTQATLSVNGKETTESRPFAASGFEGEVKEAMKCFRSGKIESPGMTHEQTLKNMELMDGIRNMVGLIYPFE